MKNNVGSRHWIRLLVQRALITAIYLVLTLVFAPIAYGSVQFRVSEVMMVLPAISSAGVWGVTLGCFLANLLNPSNLGPIDIIFGTLATFLAAIMTRYLGQKLLPPMSDLTWKHPKLYLLTLPTILFNALIVGTYLPFLLLESQSSAIVTLSILSVGLGELGVMLILGLPLLITLIRIEKKQGPIFVN